MVNGHERRIEREGHVPGELHETLVSAVGPEQTSSIVSSIRSSITKKRVVFFYPSKYLTRKI